MWFGIKGSWCLRFRPARQNEVQIIIITILIIIKQEIVYQSYVFVDRQKRLERVHWSGQGPQATFQNNKGTAT